MARGSDHETRLRRVEPLISVALAYVGRKLGLEWSPSRGGRSSRSRRSSTPSGGCRTTTSSGSNPFQNLRAYVLGVQDRNYTVVGRAPVLTVQRDDLQPPERGWQWCLLKLPLPLPFVSYSGPRSVFYVGWQPTGFFGFKATGWALYVALAAILAGVGAVLI